MYRTMPLGIVLRRAPGVTRWAKWSWKATAVLPGAGEADWRELRRDGEAAEFHAATEMLELHGAETEAYLHGLTAEIPSLYVIMREMAGLPTMAPLDGEFDLLETIMRPEGMKRFKSYLASHPEMTTAEHPRVIAAFLDKYVIDDALEEELDMPSWTEELVEEMTEVYDEDVARIQEIPGVRVILP